MTPARERLAAAALGVGTGAVYLATLSQDHTVDAVIYAGQAEKAALSGALSLTLFNPAHVLHTAFGAALGAGFYALELPVRVLTVNQVVSALAGGVLAGLLFLWTARRARAPWTAGAGVLCLALSGGVWAFAGQGEPNLPALALAVAALFPITRLLRPEGSEAGAGPVLGGGVLLGLAAGFHLTLGTLWIALLLGSAGAPRARLARVGGTLAVAALVLGLCYLPRALLLLREPGAGPADLVTFSGESPYRSYLGRSAFDPAAQLESTIKAQAPQGTLPAAWAAPARLVPLLWLAAALTAHFFRPWRAGRLARLGPTLLLWFLANLVLYAAWADRNFEFQAFLLVPLAAAGILGLGGILDEDDGGVPPRRDRACGALLGAGALATALVTGAGTILPGLDPSTSPAHRAVELVARETPPGRPVVVAGGPETRHKVYIPYFAGRPVLVPDFYFGPSLSLEASLRRFEERVRQACRGGPVYALGHVAGEEGREEFEGIPYGEVRRRLRAWSPRPRARTRDGLVLWRMEGCPG